MNKLFIVIALAILLASGCLKNSEETDLIDYEILGEIKTELSTEIGESEEYFPRQLRDLILMSDGSLLVSDLGKTTIEQFNGEGEYMGTVAEEGGGPGELSSFFLLYQGQMMLLLFAITVRLMFMKERQMIGSLSMNGQQSLTGVMTGM